MNIASAKQYPTLNTPLKEPSPDLGRIPPDAEPALVRRKRSNPSFERLPMRKDQAAAAGERPDHSASALPLTSWIEGKARGAARRLRARAVRHGVAPGLFGYRHVETETVGDHVARVLSKGAGTARFETIHSESIASNAMPRNVSSRDDLPDDAGWWGYSMRDVPTRVSGETFIATIPKARIVSFIDEKNEFYPAILSCDDTAINLREIVFRHGHATRLRTKDYGSRNPQRLERATWILERVYDNHSHWLTAHLPKLCLLRERGQLDDVILPEKLKPAMAASLKLMGLDPSQFRTFDQNRPLLVEELTILGTDRFRPELLRPVREAVAASVEADAPTRRIYISRSRARFRRLLNEEEIWPLFENEGFERVYMEEMSFHEQVRMMRETNVLAAPHGAGLTNMMFCPEGAHVVEIACLGFPNPNFYAVASAMGHDYSIVSADASGDVPPLEQDLVVQPDAVLAALRGLADPIRRKPRET